MARTWALKEDSVNTTIVHWYSTTPHRTDQSRPEKATPVVEQSLERKKNKKNPDRAEGKHRHHKIKKSRPEQPIQPEVGDEACKERESKEEAPLDTFERSLLDILEED